jgi:hypothetical protein
MAAAFEQDPSNDLHRLGGHIGGAQSRYRVPSPATQASHLFLPPSQSAASSNRRFDDRNPLDELKLPLSPGYTEMPY